MSRGRIEVISGCMFSGKSEELVRRLRRAVIAKKVVKAFKPAIDDRYHTQKIGCHGGATFDAVPLHTLDDVLPLVSYTDVVGFDEAQFFHPGLVDLAETLANRGVVVIIAGLDMDSDGKPFGPIPHLMAAAEHVTKLHAICMVCGEDASRSFHKTGKTEQVEVGADAYEARCRGCCQV